MVIKAFVKFRNGVVSISRDEATFKNQIVLYDDASGATSSLERCKNSKIIAATDDEGWQHIFKPIWTTT